MKSLTSSPLVIFDLGGVVVRLCPTTQATAKRAGVPWRTPAHPERPHEVAHLLIEWQLGRIGDDAFFDAWAGALGGRFDGGEARRISECWLLGEYEGIEPIGRHLMDRGIVLGCLSNTCNHHWEMMLGQGERYPTVARMAHRHASHLFGCMKPDPEIFERFEQAVERKGPDLIYFDDIMENAQAAKERGWQAFPIVRDQPPAAQIRAGLHVAGVW